MKSFGVGLGRPQNLAEPTSDATRQSRSELHFALAAPSVLKNLVQKFIKNLRIRESDLE